MRQSSDQGRPDLAQCCQQTFGCFQIGCLRTFRELLEGWLEKLTLAPARPDTSRRIIRATRSWTLVPVEPRGRVVQFFSPRRGTPVALEGGVTYLGYRAYSIERTRNRSGGMPNSDTVEQANRNLVLALAAASLLGVPINLM